MGRWGATGWEWVIGDGGGFQGGNWLCVCGGGLQHSTGHTALSCTTDGNSMIIRNLLPIRYIPHVISGGEPLQTPKAVAPTTSARAPSTSPYPLACRAPETSARGAHPRVPKRAWYVSQSTQPLTATSGWGMGLGGHRGDMW